MLNDVTVRVQSLWSTFVADLPGFGTLSPLDYLCLILLGIFGLDGIRRGFILGALDIAALVAGLAAATILNSQFGAQIHDLWPISSGLANTLGFIGIFVGVQVVYALGVSLITHTIGPLIAALTPVRMLNTLLGGVPGFVKGTMVLAVLFSTLHMLPMASEIRGVLSDSVVINRTVPLGASIVPEIPALLRGLGINSTTLAPPPLVTSPRTANGIPFPVVANSQYDPPAEMKMLDLINRERENAGVPLLVADTTLQVAAREHSTEMFRLGYFAHESPTAGSPFDRMVTAGAKFSTAGENLAYAPNLETAHRGLMNSPGHRENILQPRYRRVGIGVAQSGSGVRMFTQNFSD